MRDDEARIYEMITRRFLAAFMPSAEWLHVSA
jgi:DNA topoisomerase IA